MLASEAATHLEPLAGVYRPAAAALDPDLQFAPAHPPHPLDRVLHHHLLPARLQLQSVSTVSHGHHHKQFCQRQAGSLVVCWWCTVKLLSKIISA